MAASLANPDIILIGGGVMSANLGALIRKLDPGLRIQVFERGEEMALESSNGWSNAGTGHAGLCELSYTPSRGASGAVNVDKALEIFGQFEETLQFWSHAVSSGMAGPPADFIRPVPHLSFVHGREQVEFLRSRYAGLSRHPFFETMEFTTDPDVIAGWAPLLMEGRERIPVAATRVAEGTDVNFGVLARRLLAWLGAQEGCAVASRHRVEALRRCEGGWEVEVTDLAEGTSRVCRAKFVFVGAGGGSLPLLQKAGIPEARGLGGFPIGGQWLVCRKPEIVSRHQAKVYGQALDAAPTMAVPHLDTRVLDGQKALLFGPFAAWTGKFLQRHGSWLDLPLSVRPDNLLTLLRIGWSNLPLIHYLMREGSQSMDSRLALLRQFYPQAHEEDWTLERAGIRVQAIKKTDGEAGIVHYGTELIKSADHSIAALLGASPGASVCVHIALGVIHACLPHLLDSEEGRERMGEMIPARGEELRRPENSGKFRELHRHCLKTLELI